MKDFKMSNWFKLPVSCCVICNDAIDDNSLDSIAINGHIILTDHHADKVEAAINSYDKLTDQNKSLKAAIKTACDKKSKVGCDGVVMMSVENFNALVAAYNECSDD